MATELGILISDRLAIKIPEDELFWSESYGKRVLILAGGVIHDFGESIAALAKLGGLAISLMGDALDFALTLPATISNADWETLRAELEALGLRIEGGYAELRKLAQDGADIFLQLINDPPNPPPSARFCAQMDRIEHAR